MGITKPQIFSSRQKVILWPAAVVVTFGLMQVTILPPDFLAHFGYGANTIPAIQTIDQKLDYQRIQSTLRGANPLGAYLVLIITIATAAAIKFKASRQRLALLILGALGALLFSYSRSAYLGMCVAIVAVVYWAITSFRGRRLVVMSCLVLSLIGLSSLALLRNNDRFQNILFHTDENSTSGKSSNEGRAAALQGGWRDLSTGPLGRGPGTAGPASAHNDQPARISENYYLQVGQETGWLGLSLLVAIQYAVGRRLWLRRVDPLALGLLASLLGLTLVNLLSHAWGDDTLAWLWWGLTGIALGSAIIQPDSKSNQNGKKNSPKNLHLSRTETHR